MHSGSPLGKIYFRSRLPHPLPHQKQYLAKSVVWRKLNRPLIRRPARLNGYKPVRARESPTQAWKKRRKLDPKTDIGWRSRVVNWAESATRCSPKAWEVAKWACRLSASGSAKNTGLRWWFLGSSRPLQRCPLALSSTIRPGLGGGAVIRITSTRALPVIQTPLLRAAVKAP